MFWDFGVTPSSEGKFVNCKPPLKYSYQCLLFINSQSKEPVRADCDQRERPIDSNCNCPSGFFVWTIVLVVWLVWVYPSLLLHPFGSIKVMDTCASPARSSLRICRAVERMTNVHLVLFATKT